MKRGIIVGSITAIAAITAFNAGLALHLSGAEANTPPPAGLISSAPSRVLDTRTGSKVPAGGTVSVHTPAFGVSAVAVNITMTRTEAPGYVTAWAGGSQPNASIINSGGQSDIANFAIVPVAADGSFQLYASSTTDLIVDYMGYFTASGAIVPPSGGGLSATITGYGPSFSITEVSGTVTNGTSVEKDVRVDIRCPDGTVETDSQFSMAPGQTLGFSVLCNGAFASGASVLAVVEI